MIKKYHLENVQIYITNVCNLTCENCITYNNFNFKGHFYFQDHETYYKEWSKMLDLDSITIIGGEPFANPKLVDWIDSINILWPNLKEIDISTNGTYLKDKINVCQNLIKKNVWLNISVHDPIFFDEIEENLKQICSIFPKMRKEKNNNNSYTYYVDHKKIAVLETKYIFGKKSLYNIKNNTIYMHNSDPNKSHGECGYCYTFMKGQLYKCFLTAIGEDLCKQFTVEETAKKLLLTYKSCSPFDSDEKIKHFIKNLNNPIEQCKLCVETTTIKQIWPLTKLKTKLS